MAEFKLSRLKFTWKGNWTAATEYIKDDVVRYGAKTYVCLEGHTAAVNFYVDSTHVDYTTTPPTDAPKWELMFDGYEWKNEWEKNTWYNLGDIVKDNGIIYICTTQHQSTSIDLHAQQSNWTSYGRSEYWQGDWDSNIKYRVGDIVKYYGILYRCTQQHTSSNLPSGLSSGGGLEANISSWEIVNYGWSWKTDWAPATRYMERDVIKYGGIVYRCIEKHASGNYLAGLEADQSKWEIVHEGIEYKGAWLPAVRYKVNDVVKWGAGTWICHTHHKSATLDPLAGETIDNTVAFDDTKWNVYIPGLEYEENWSASRVYQKGDIVRFGGYTYTALLNNYNEQPSLTPLVWENLTQGFDILGDWQNGLQYNVGQVVRRRGQLYVSLVDTTVDPTTPAQTDWELIIPGDMFFNSWQITRQYTVGDIVTLDGTTYLSKTLHVSTFNNRPDNDYDRINWNILIRGEPTNRLRTQGDLATYGLTEDGSSIDLTRLSIGSAGQLLKVSDGEPGWNTFGQHLKIYYVANHGTDDSTTHGLSLEAPFKTIRYACDNITGPATIFIKTGVYYEELPITIPNDVALVGEELRSTIVKPTVKTTTTTGPGGPVTTTIDYSFGYDMFWVNNGTGIRNMTLMGLTGSLGDLNAYLTRRPTGGSYVSLNPGSGPSDTTAWITSKSCYVQNVTTFGTGCTGLKVDGALHNGGNKSVVANDFTQVLSDGIGCWVNLDARVELVSVFSYYGHIGYLSENGGKIRATNGNSSYGTFGCVAEGANPSEVPNSGTQNNRLFPAQVVSAFSGEANDYILNLEYSNAGQNYTAASYTFLGSGTGAAVIADEFRDNAIFEARIIDDSNGLAPPGGLGYISAGNNAQSGNTTSIVLATGDKNTAATYVGARLIIISGTGTGQYGYIQAYDFTSKTATIYKEETGTAGWDHVIPGTPAVSLLDTTSVYRIEARVTFSAPPFSATTGTLPTSGTWSDIAYGNGVWIIIQVSSNQALRSTNNGASWSTITLPASANWNVIKYIGDKFVALSGSNTLVISSTDGSSWNSGTLPNANFWTDVTYGNGKWVACATGANNIIAYSSDTLSWNISSTIPGTAGEFARVAFGGGKFVAIQGSGVLFAVTPALYSTDGNVWAVSPTGLPSPGISRSWRSVAYGNGRFIAVVGGNSGTSTVGAGSFDGISWTAITKPVEVTEIAYKQGVFIGISVASALDAPAVIQTSPNGVTWTARTVPSAARSGIAFGNPGGVGRWIAIPTSGATIDIISTGARAQGRVVVSGNSIASIKLWEPGSGYTTTPTCLLTDPSSTASAYVLCRTGIGVLGNPTFTNRGVGYKTSTTITTISGDGFADIIPYGKTMYVSGLHKYPNVGANLTFDTVDWVSKPLGVSDNWSAVGYGSNRFVAVANSAGVNLGTASDASTGPVTLTVNGNIFKSTDNPSGGSGGSLFFPGTASDYIRVGTKAGMNIGTTDCTLETWFKIPIGTVQSTNATIYGKKWGSGNEFTLQTAGGNSNIYRMYTNAGQFSDYSITPADGTWHHIALVKNGVNIYLWLDGVLRGTQTLSIAAQQSFRFDDAMIGGQWDNTLSTPGPSTFVTQWKGFLYGLRISNTARYTTTFTPSATYTTDANTVLMMSTATGATVTTAAYSDDGLSWTPTAIPAAGRWSSVAYNGTNRWLAVSTNNDNKTIYSTNGSTWAQPATTQTEVFYSPLSFYSGNGVPANLSVTMGSANRSFNITTDSVPGLSIAGTYPNAQNGNAITDQNLAITIPYRGGKNTAAGSPVAVGTGSIGITDVGILLYGPSAGVTATGAAATTWNVNAIVAGIFGEDIYSGSPAPGGIYNLRTSAFITNDAWGAITAWSGGYTHTDGHSKLLGFANDGYPIYGPYGYVTPAVNTSGVQLMVSGYTASIKTNRPVARTFDTATASVSSQIVEAVSTANLTKGMTITGPGIGLGVKIINIVGNTITLNLPISVTNGITLTADYDLGVFLEDWTYSATGATLDSHNGRYCVTPEYPHGTYAYFMTQDAFDVPTYPYIVGPTYYGSTTVDVSGVGTNPSTVTVFPITPLPTGNWSCMAYGAGKFVTLNAGTGQAATTTDGFTWIPQIVGNTETWSSIAFGNGEFVAVATGTNKAYTSADGQTWYQNSIGVTANWKSVAYGNGLFVAVASGGTVAAVSTDLGQSWTAGVLPSTASWSSVVYGNKKFIAVSSDGVSATSKDGVTWKIRTMPSGTWNVVANGNLKYIALGNGNTVAEASDGGDAQNYILQTITYVSGTALAGLTFKLTVSPAFTKTTGVPHNTDLDVREQYSQVRLTGHDFLSIGSGNFEQTNYPGFSLQQLQPENETYFKGGGRVFYTSTDQDGNFRVGELFAVEQATGVVTISADYFNLNGVSQLTLGGVKVGGTSVVVNEFSTDNTFTADSNNVIPTQKAIKAYIARRISGGGSDARTGTLIAGTVRIGPQRIDTTTGLVLQWKKKVKLTRPYDGKARALQHFLQGFGGDGADDYYNN